MSELEKKKIIIDRIVAHLNPVPSGAANELLQQSFADLQVILEKLVTSREQENVEEAALAQVREAQAQRASDGAWGAALCRIDLNGKRLCDVESNRQMFESLLQPHETPSEAIYKTLALQFASKFSWEAPRPRTTDADRLAEFARICRENNLSECAANQQLHREGAALENFAGASQVELQKFHAKAAQARQKFLINSATPSELRAESRYQSATEREIAIKAEADRQHQFVSQQQQQSGIYPPLPATMPDTGEIIDSRFIKRLSTLDYARFRAMVKRYGTAQITEVLRTPAAPTV
jgi:hypothetical protein